MVMSQSLYKVLKQRHSECDITVMAPAWTQPLLERMPEVSQSMALDLQHGELNLGKRREIGKSLREAGFTDAIVLPNSLKSALIPFHAGIRRRVGWRGEMRYLLLNDCRHLNKAAFPLMVQRFAALGTANADRPPEDIPRPGLVASFEQMHQAREKYALQSLSPVLALCPGAEFGSSKQWPAEHYAELSNYLLRAGWQVWIFGSGNDSLMAEAIMADIDDEQRGHCHDLTGKTTLGEAIDLLSQSECVVSNDSGLMHIAAALGKPIVALFGSTSPEFTPPLTDKVKLLSTQIECRPCFKRECPYGHKRCLTEIKPEQAVAAIYELAS